MQRTKHYRGRIGQIPIYLGKCFRMFVYMDDWKVLPMAAIIAGLVTFVVKGTMGINMEGTMKGSLALSCICIWNGFFNSIQVVCREREILKREHRSGMHITSYISANMIYQACLCLVQSIITITVCKAMGMALPTQGIATPFAILDMCITFFLITYASDMMSLWISCIAKNTTAAMTMMPFILIFQLLFSGAVFSLTGSAEVLSNFTIAKWGMCAICATASYNSLPMVSVWNMMKQLQNYEYNGMQPIKLVVDNIEANGRIDEFCLQVGQSSQKIEYASTNANLTDCWITLVIFIFVFAVLAVLFLKGIDKDKR